MTAVGAVEDMDDHKANYVNSSEGTVEGIEEKLSRCFSMVLHYPEIGRILEAAKRVQRIPGSTQREDEKDGSNE